MVSSAEPPKPDSLTEFEVAGEQPAISSKRRELHRNGTYLHLLLSR